MKSVSSQTDNVKDILPSLPVDEPIIVSCSETEFEPLVSYARMQTNSTQTVDPTVISKVESVCVTSIGCQTEVIADSSLSKFTSRTSQTDSTETLSSYSQTEIFKSSPNFTQTEFNLMCTSSSQTFITAVTNKFSQTDYEWMRSTSSQTVLSVKPYSDAHPLQLSKKPRGIGRLILKWTFKGFGILATILIGILVLIFMFLYLCQGNRCQMQLRYSRPPPV